MPVRAIIILFDVWHTNVLLAPICDKNRLKAGMILASAGFYKLSFRTPREKTRAFQLLIMWKTLPRYVDTRLLA